MKRIKLKIISVGILLTVLVSSISPRTTASAASLPIHHIFERPIILIDAGHGGIDGGTSYGDILEKDINLQMGRRLYVLLRSYGYNTVLNRTGDYALSDDNRWLAVRSRHLRDLAQRKELNEELVPSIVISLHVNWSGQASDRGPLVLHQKEGASTMLAHFLQHSLNRIYACHKLPRVGKPFYLLNYTHAPTVIVETGFISNARDRKWLTDPAGQRKITQALAEGVLHYFTVM